MRRYAAESLGQIVSLNVGVYQDTTWFNIPSASDLQNYISLIVSSSVVVIVVVVLSFVFGRSGAVSSHSVFGQAPDRL